VRWKVPSAASATGRRRRGRILARACAEGGASSGARQACDCRTRLGKADGGS